MYSAMSETIMSSDCTTSKPTQKGVSPDL